MPGDRRARQVCLTPKGRQVVEDSIAARQQWLDEIGQNLTAVQKTEVAKALHTLAEAATRAEGKTMPADVAAHAPPAHKPHKAKAA